LLQASALRDAALSIVRNIVEDLEEVLEASAALSLPAARALRQEYCDARERAHQQHPNLAAEFQVLVLMCLRISMKTITERISSSATHGVLAAGRKQCVVHMQESESACGPTYMFWVRAAGPCCPFTHGTSQLKPRPA
jgi:hypothetical protein